MYTQRLLTFYPLILCYHAVSSSWPSGLAVPDDLLRRHVGHLRRRSYQGFTLAELERRRAAGTLPRRAVAITFDDGYASNLKAAPILAEAGFPATVYVVTRFVDSGEPLRWTGVDHWCDGPHGPELRPLTWGQLEELAHAGWEVGSHTVTHPFLTDVGDDELARQLEESRRTIASRLGSCETVAYPYGFADDRVAAAAAKAGYLAAATLTAAHTVDTPYLRPRIGLYPVDRGLRMRIKLSQAFTAFRRTAVAAALDGLRSSMGDLTAAR